MENVLSGVVGKSDGGAILLAVIIAVVLIVLIKVLYKPVTEHLEKKEQKKNEREAKLLEVIQGNSSVMAELKTLLTSTNDNCRTCKTEQIAYFKTFENKQDAASLVLNDIEHNIDTIAQNLTEGKNNCIVVLTKLDSLVTALQHKEKEA